MTFHIAHTVKYAPHNSRDAALSPGSTNAGADDCMRKWLSKYWKWIAIAVTMIAVAASAKAFLPLDDWMKALCSWVEKLGLFGVVVIALIYAAATVLFVPGCILTIAAGLILGVGLGMVAAWTGAVLGSSLAFLIGRHLARSKIEAKTKGNEKFAAIDEAIGKQGWKIIGLLRLSPLIPFNASNYFYGITKVGFWPYFLATAGGILPGTLLNVYLGAAGKAGIEGSSNEHSSLGYVLFGVGLIATIGVTIWVSRLAKNALKESGTAKNKDDQ